MATRIAHFIICTGHRAQRAGNMILLYNNQPISPAHDRFVSSETSSSKHQHWMNRLEVHREPMADDHSGKLMLMPNNTGVIFLAIPL